MQDSASTNNNIENYGRSQVAGSSFASKGYPDDAALLLKTLFGEFTNCYVELRLLRKGSDPIQLFHSSVDKIPWDLIERKNSDGYSCYFGVCLRKTQKGNKSSVASVSTLWADLDGKNLGGGKPEALAQLQRLPPYLYPSIIVDSGHGYHLYWLLREAEIIESTEEILKLEGYMKGLALTLNGDSTSDLGRVLRLPGLLNQKDLEDPCLCHIIHYEPARRFTPLDFDDYQVEIPKKTTQTKTGRPEEIRQRSDKFNDLAIGKLLESCSFIQHCQDNAISLPEPWWWAMVHVLAVFGEPGKKKIHELSNPYPRYTERETERKIEEALKAADKDVGPHSCVFIKQNLGFACPDDCLAKKQSIKSPAGLATRLARFASFPTIIVTNRFLKEKVADTVAAVEQANKPAKIFERSSHIVRVSYDEFGAPYIETLSESACRGFLERVANFVRLNDKGEMAPLPAPPLDIVRDFMSLPNRNLPALLAVTEAPVLRGDGSLVIEPGYDEATRLYYQPAGGLNMPTVPATPSQKQLEVAVALIQEPLVDFPLDSQASRANALALMVTPIYRPIITGPVPLCVIDKPQPGTGAGLLADVIAVIATGRPAAMMAPPKNDEECEKRLTSILRRGRTILTIDNMDGYLYFASLAMILTATTVQTRILGQSEELLLPNRATYIVTGNNVRLAGDLPRRCYLCRMDAREARPWLRDPKSFKYQHLIQWAKEHRGELLAAILTMARAWVATGKPLPDRAPALGGFEDWTDIVGGILAHAGIRGFLGNLEFMYTQSDVETTDWGNFLIAWVELFGENEVTVAEVIKAISECGDFASALPDIVDRDPKRINRSLARALSKRNGVRYPNGLTITKSDKVVHHAAAWQVLDFREGLKKGELENQKIADLDTKGELGELATPLRSYLLEEKR